MTCIGSHTCLFLWHLSVCAYVPICVMFYVCIGHKSLKQAKRTQAQEYKLIIYKLESKASFIWQTGDNCVGCKLFTTTWGRQYFFCRQVRLTAITKNMNWDIKTLFFTALPLRGVRFRRSRKAAPDWRASIRLSITPVSSPSVREQIIKAKMFRGSYVVYVYIEMKYKITHAHEYVHVHISTYTCTWMLQGLILGILAQKQWMPFNYRCMNNHLTSQRESTLIQSEI